MSVNIHPTAIIEPGAELGNDVSIGAYSVIGANVKIGDGTKIAPQVVIEGHTDSIPVTGSLQQVFPSNWELSVARAANAVSFMQGAGNFNPTNLSASGFGEFRPVAGNDTREGRALNRRIEVVVSPTN